MISRRGRSIGGAKQAAVLFEFLGVLKREKKLVIKAERQILRGRRLVRKRRREEAFGLREYRRWKSDDDFFGFDCAVRRFDPEALPAVVDPLHRTIEPTGNESPQAAIVAP